MNLKHNIKYRPLVLSLVLPLAVGALSAFLTKDAMKLFGAVRQPPFSPPAWLFPVMWTMLYILMGIASYLIWLTYAGYLNLGVWLLNR